VKEVLQLDSLTQFAELGGKLPEIDDVSLEDPTPRENTPYCLVGTARAKPGLADNLEQRLLSLVEPTRSEPGVLEYHVHRDRNDSDHFIFNEAWRSVSDLREHGGPSS
jgi:hypothetical protein